MAVPHILTLSRWFGLFPFDDFGRFNLNSAFRGLSLTLLTVVIQSARLAYEFAVINKTKTNSLVSFLFVLLYVCSVITPIVHLHAMIKNRRKLIFLKDLIHDSISRTFSTIFFFTYRIATLVLSDVLTFVVKMDYDSRFKMLISSVSNLFTFVDLIIILQYSSIVKLLKANFCLIKNTSDVDRHENLVVTSMIIDLLFGRQILIFLIGLLVNLTVECYSFFWIYHAPPFGFHWYCNFAVCLKYSLNITFLGVVLLYVCETCSSTCSEAETFNHELFRMMRANDRLCNNKKLHLYVTMKQTVEFTACGFFKLGYPLVTSIIAAATTYLVILIQFSFPKPTK